MIDIIIPSAVQGLKTRGIYTLKALIKLNKETIIQRQIRILSKLYPNCRFIIPVGFQRNKIKEHLKTQNNVKFVVNKEYETTSIVKSIELGLKKTRPDLPLLIINTDLVFDETFWSFGPLDKSSVFSHYNKEKTTEVGLSFTYENKVIQFSYGLDLKWSNVLYLNPKDKIILLKNINNKLSSRLLFHEILNNCIKDGLLIDIIHGYTNHIIEINSLKDISNARKII